MKKILSVLGLALTVTVGGLLATPAMAGPHHGFDSMGGRDLMHMMHKFAELDLTDEQRDAIRQIRKDAVAKFRANKEARMDFRGQMRDLIRSDNFDETAARALIDEQQERHGEMMLMQMQVRNQIWNLLTPEQQAKAEEIKFGRHGRHHGKRHKHHHGKYQHDKHKDEDHTESEQ